MTVGSQMVVEENSIQDEKLVTLGHDSKFNSQADTVDRTVNSDFHAPNPA
jgi:hypothetical protein